MSYFQLGEIAVMSSKLKVIITSCPDKASLTQIYTVKVINNYNKLSSEVLCSQSGLTKVFEKSTMSFQELMNSFSEA